MKSGANCAASTLHIVSVFKLRKVVALKNIYSFFRRKFSRRDFFRFAVAGPVNWRKSVGRSRGKQSERCKFPPQVLTSENVETFKKAGSARDVQVKSGTQVPHNPQAGASAERAQDMQ